MTLLPHETEAMQIARMTNILFMSSVRVIINKNTKYYILKCQSETLHSSCKFTIFADSYRIFDYMIIKTDMKKVLCFIIAAAVLMPSCGQSDNSTEQVDTAPAKKVLTVKTQACLVPFTSPAQIRGKLDINIYPQVEGTLEEVLVSEGQNVRKGQRMFIVNSVPYQAAVDNAQAAVNVAKTNVATYELEANATRDLYEKGVVAEHQYKVHSNALEVAKAQLAEAEAALKHARNDLSHTVVTAPNDGVVGTINYRQGSLVSAALPQPLTVVSDNRVVYAYVSMNSDTYLELVREAGGKDKLMDMIPEAELILGNGLVYDKKGHLETISGIIDEVTGSVSMRVAFDNPDGILAAGGSGTLRTNWSYDGIPIPRSATYEIQDKHFVYKVQNEGGVYKAVSQAVEVYRLNDTEYLVESGLTDGDMIVVEGVSKMTNGMEITIKD